MKNSISLDIIHPQKSRVEHFLNTVSDDLEQIAFDHNELRGIDDTATVFKFRVKDRSAFIIVIFATSYSQATEIEAANLFAGINVKWTINGAILFGVESADEQLSKELLSFFAGRE